MTQPGLILNSQGEPVSLSIDNKTISLEDTQELRNAVPIVPFNPMGLPQFAGQGGGQELSQWDTLFDNLRYYLLSNNRQLISYAIAEIGLVRTICDVPVSDGLRGGIEIKTEQLDEKQISQLQRTMTLKKDLAVAGRAMSKTRGFGGGGIVVLTDQDPKTELDIEAIRPGSPLEFKAADLWELFWDVNDTGQYDPSIAIENVKAYRYYNVSVDKSRVMPLIGIDPPSFIRPRLRGWGLSELEILVRGINQFLKSQNVAFEVLDEFKIDVYKIKNLLNSLLTPVGQANVRARVNLANQIKNFQKALVMDAEDDFDHKTITFSGIPEMMAQFRIGICGDMRMPMTKLFGISLSGLSSTDEGDFEVYNGMVESDVREKLREPLLKIASYRCQQLFGFIPDDLETGFKPLRVLSAEGEENVKTSKFNRLLGAVQANKITDLEFRERCNHANLLEKPLDTDDSRLNPDELKEEPEPGQEPEKKPGDKPLSTAPKKKANAVEAKLNGIIGHLKTFMGILNSREGEPGDVDIKSLLAAYESDGGAEQFTNEQLTEAINHVANGPVWEKAKEATQKEYGHLKWPVVMYLYKKMGG
jgi:phage-related protein (TIGR01555 family)